MSATLSACAEAEASKAAIKTAPPAAKGSVTKRRATNGSATNSSLKDPAACQRWFIPSLLNCGGPQEGEVAALIGAQNLLRVQLGIAALGLRLRRLRHGRALFQFGLPDQEIDTALLHRQPDALA